VPAEGILSYDLGELDIGHPLREEIPRHVEILEEQAAEQEEDPTIHIDYKDLIRPSSADEPSPATTTLSDAATDAANVKDSREQLRTLAQTLEPPEASYKKEIGVAFSVENILLEGFRRSRNKPHKDIYSAALTTTSCLSPFHTAFATGVARPEEAAIQDKQHRDTLPAEPRNWKQMQRHRFTANFNLAAEIEIRDLSKRSTYE
jgi:hypothetical protein